MTDAVPPNPGNRRTLLLMIGMLVLVIAAATTVYQLAEEGVIDLPALLGTSNRGVLVHPPLALSALELHTERAGAQDYGALEPKWTLLVASMEGCDERCEQSLYLTRQVRVALGRDLPRVRRVLLTASPVEQGLRDWLLREHDDLLILHAKPDSIRQLQMAVEGIAHPAYFIADPQGWVMMTYRQQQNPKDLLGDMKFLLRNSAS